MVAMLDSILMGMPGLRAHELPRAADSGALIARRSTRARLKRTKDEKDHDDAISRSDDDEDRAGNCVIEMPKRHRKADPAVVDGLVESMRRVGLLSPILLRSANDTRRVKGRAFGDSGLLLRYGALVVKVRAIATYPW